jgi:glycosyltransferase involved in cell wall biosynthesis
VGTAARRVLFLDQFSDMGGAQRCLAELIPSAPGAGWEAQLAAPGEGSLVRTLRETGIPVHGLPLGDYSLGRKSAAEAIRFLRDIGPLAARIGELVRASRPSVLYVNGPRLMPAVARARTGLPVLFHSHSRVSLTGGRLLVASALRATRATVIAASHLLSRQWSGAPRVIYGGVEGPGPGWSRRPAAGAPRIGHIGRFVASKGQREFVRAAAALGDRSPRPEFYLCGDALFGDRAGARYRDRVLRSAPPAVRHLGWRDDVYDVLAGLDLLVLPSGEEGGIPSVVLEAFASGVAVLACPAGGIPEILVDGDSGFLLASGRAGAIAGRLEELLGAPGRIAEVAARAQRLWRERFTAARFRSEIWETIAQAAG